MDQPQKYPKIGVGIMITRGNQILLGQRHPDPKKASSELHGEGTWTMPGGKLKFGEKLVNAARREVKEEIGVRLSPKQFRIISIADDIGKDVHFVTFGFLVSDFQKEPKVMEPDEITCWKWFNLKKLPSPIYPPSQEVLDNFRKKKLLK